jgi:hypothetical protein
MVTPSTTLPVLFAAVSCALFTCGCAPSWQPARGLGMFLRGIPEQGSPSLLGWAGLQSGIKTFRIRREPMLFPSVHVEYFAPAFASPRR